MQIRRGESRGTAGSFVVACGEEAPRRRRQTAILTACPCEITPKSIAGLVRRYEGKAKQANVLPVRLRFLMERLDVLERNLTLG